MTMYFGQYSIDAAALTPDPSGGGPRFALLIDFDGDGVFTEDENLSADLLSFECSRGRDYASQLTGRSKAGQLNATLDNDDGKYSSFETGSPLYGMVTPGRRVGLWITTPISAPLWTGVLDRIEAGTGPIPTAVLRCSGVFIRLSAPNGTVNVTPMQDEVTSTVAEAILDAANWPAADRDIDLGSMMVGRYFPGPSQALDLLREIVDDTEGGFLYEDLAWGVRGEGRYFRELNSTVSQATFSDDVAEPLGYLDDIKQDDPGPRIYNRFTVAIPQYTVNAEATLWTLGGEFPTLIPGEVRTYFAKLPSGALYAEEWTTYEIGRDSTVINGGAIVPGVEDDLGDVAITITPFSDSAKIRLENVDVSDHQITALSLAGITISAADGFTLEVEDTASQAAYTNGVARTYPFPSRWIANAAYGRMLINDGLAKNKDLHPVLSFSIPSAASGYIATAVGLAISDRVTVEATGLRTRLGIVEDFYVENIAHRWDAESGIIETAFQLAIADALVDLFLVESSLLDGTDVLG